MDYFTNEMQDVMSWISDAQDYLKKFIDEHKDKIDPRVAALVKTKLDEAELWLTRIEKN